MSTSKKILGNTFIQFFGRFVSALLAIISVKLITHYLGVEGYGQYTTVYEFVGLFAIIGDMGLYTIAIREMADNEDQKQKIYSNVLAMRAIFTLIVMIFVGILGMFIPKYQGTLIPTGVFICTIAVWLNLFYSIITSILQYELKMHHATIALIIGKIFGVIFTAYIVFKISNQNFGFYFIVGSGIVAHGVMTIVSIFYARKFINIKFAIDFEYWKYLISKSWQYGLALVLGTIYFKVDVTLLSIMRSQSEVGIYGVPLRMTEVLVSLPLFFMNSVLGTMTKSLKESKEKFQKIFFLSFQFLITIAIPIFIFIYFFSSDLIRIIANENFIAKNGSYGSDSVLVLMTIGLIVSFISTLCSFTFVVFKKQQKVLVINSIGAIFNICTNLYFIPIFGFMGSAWASLASQILILIVSFYLLLKIYPFHFEYGIILKTFLIGIISFFALLYIIPTMNNIHIILRMLFSGIIASFIYLGGLFILGVLKRGMLKIE